MILETERLILRPMEETDAQALFPLINDSDVTFNTLRIPHPYPEDELAPLIRKSREAAERRERFGMAIVLRETGLAVGSCDLLDISWEHMRAEFGYWLGKPYWGRGIMTEAVKRMLEFGFEELGLERIWAFCFTRNQASARVLEKAGLTREACIRHAVRKDGEFLDVFLYGIIRGDFSAGR